MTGEEPGAAAPDAFDRLSPRVWGLPVRCATRPPGREGRPALTKTRNDRNGLRRLLRGRNSNEKLGTFIGVFTPSILTILGVILYLRTGWVVGNVGLLPALAIVIIANSVTLITALSVSAVATNMRVGTGGAYYIISRSLGIEVGAAIGIPLYLAMVFSVTLYAFGLAESVRVVWAGAPQRPIAALTVLAVGFLAARGAGVALRLQIPIMVGIALSLVALVVGASGQAASQVPVSSSVQDAAQFWTVFAVFFPAVTGIMAGVSLSGDLARPNRSIPYGTISAVLVGFVVYMAVPVVLSLAATPEALVEDNLIWFDIAGPLAFLVLWGLWGAIFSSAVGSILGAPRTLEAMVDDRILPKPLGLRSRRVKGPGVPLVLTTLLALLAVGLGDLNSVAPVLTMFFLTTYGTVNLVAGLERLSGDPSYRPKLTVPWWLSLSGAMACFLVMYLINPVALVVALVFEFGVYLFMKQRALTAPWGDLRRGALLALIRRTVVQLRGLREDPRNWRPNILLYADDVERRADLVRFGSWLVQDRGILTVSRLVAGPLEDHAPRVSEEVADLNRELEELGVTAFGEVDVVETFEEGAIAVAQANGIAGIASNTVMFGWATTGEQQAAVLRVIERLALLGKSAVICRAAPHNWGAKRRSIHVWWGGLQENGDMLVLFAHLLSLNPEWRSARITINSIASSEMMHAYNEESLRRLTRAARIDANIEVILKPEDTKIGDIISERSQSADVVLMGLRSISPGEESDYARRLTNLSAGLPTVLFVRNAGSFRGQLLGSTEGAVDRS